MPVAEPDAEADADADPDAGADADADPDAEADPDAGADADPDADAEPEPDADAPVAHVGAVVVAARGGDGHDCGEAERGEGATGAHRGCLLRGHAVFSSRYTAGTTRRT